MIRNKSKQEIIDLIFKIAMFFTIGCFVGVVFETLLCYFQRGYFESRKGLIYGPFNVVYGLGITAMVLVLEHYRKPGSIVLVGALLGGGIEYLCSWVQETFFGTTSWNYSNYFLNFDGRTSIYHMLWWGILSLLFMKFIYPEVEKLIYKVKEKYRLLIALVIIIFFLIDIFISAYANIRMQERYYHVQATTRIQSFFDRHYPDSFVHKIYPNAKRVKIKGRN